MASLLPRRWFVACAALVGQIAQAGTIEQAYIFGDPQMQVKAGAVVGCGYRLKGMPKDTALSKPFILLDTSFNLYANGLELLKGGAMLMSPKKDGQLGQPVNKPINGFWLMAGDGPPTAPVGNKVLAAEDRGYLLYGITVGASTALFAAILDGSPVTVGVRIKGEPIDRIYAGVVNVSDADKQQHQQCMTRLLKRLRSDLTEPDKASPTR